MLDIDNCKEAATPLSLSEERNYKVVKSNELIQKSRFRMSLQEQRIILYLISKIKPGDDEFITTEFKILDFCKVCGIHIDSGKNYQDIKETVKALSDQSIWIKLDNGKETLFRWIDKPLIDVKEGTMQIKFDDLLKPYLLHLRENFTQFELLYTLAMRSQYSIRLYEILRSYLYKHTIVFSVEELKTLLSATCYDRYPDFRRNVMEIATKEIDAVSDISVKYEVFKEGRRYTTIQFTMKLKEDIDERFLTWKQIQSVIGA
jgi:plasmid replication initiation protein